MLTPGFVPVTIRNQNCLTYRKFALQKSELLTYLLCLPTKLLSLLTEIKIALLTGALLKGKTVYPACFDLTLRGSLLLANCYVSLLERPSGVCFSEDLGGGGF